MFFLITADFSSQAQGRCCHDGDPQAYLPPCTRSVRAASINVALFGMLGWRIEEVTEVWSPTENLMSDSSLMESLVSGVKGTPR